jgi:hypothetical protein
MVPLLFAPLLFACGVGGSTAPVARQGLLADTISGYCESRYQFIPIDFTLPPPLSHLAAHARTPGRGVCWITRLGRMTIDADGVTDFTGDPFTFTGFVLFTAADGAQLWATDSGAIPAPGAAAAFTSSGTTTFTGGTGRFEHASGTVTFAGGGVHSDRTTFRSFQGMISYGVPDATTR